MELSIYCIEDNTGNEWNKREKQEMNSVEIRFLLNQSTDFRRCGRPRHLNVKQVWLQALWIDNREEDVA